MDPIDVSALATILRARPLLREEEKMWLWAGFYIEASRASECSSRPEQPMDWSLWDHLGCRCTINKQVGHDLRQMIIYKWERKDHPTLFSEPQAPLTEEEVQDLTSIEERSRS